MTLTIALTPSEEVRLAAVARQEGLDPTETAHKLLAASLPFASDFEGWREPGIEAEADCPEPRTLAELAAARHQFLASVSRAPLEADLPAVLLSEG